MRQCAYLHQFPLVTKNRSDKGRQKGDQRNYANENHCGSFFLFAHVFSPVGCCEHAQARQSSLPVLSPNFSTGAPAFSSMLNSRLLSGVSFGYTTWRLPLACPAPPPARTIGRS